MLTLRARRALVRATVLCLTLSGPAAAKRQPSGLSNLLSARSLLSHKGASKMLRATGHARMVTLRGTRHAKRGGAAAQQPRRAPPRETNCSSAGREAFSFEPPAGRASPRLLHSSRAQRARRALVRARLHWKPVTYQAATLRGSSLRFPFNNKAWGPQATNNSQWAFVAVILDPRAV